MTVGLTFSLHILELVYVWFSAMLLMRIFGRFARRGDIWLEGPGGKTARLTITSSPRIRLRISSRAAMTKILAHPNYYFAECYADGSLEILEGSLYDLLGSIMQGMGEGHYGLVTRTRAAREAFVDRLVGRQVGYKSASNVQYHYDLSNKFFSRMLGNTMQYSCAYFPDSSEDIDSAQLAKMRHIAAKLQIGPNDRVLDIGSGWGGLISFLSSQYGVSGTGITLSKQQLEYCQGAYRTNNLNFRLQDYRRVDETYDRVVSVGMLEHVGPRYFREYFDVVSRLLSEDGLALIHTIGRRGRPKPINPWIRKRIFPGSYLPSLSQLSEAIESTDLWLYDLENLRLHYAETLARWRERIFRDRDGIIAERSAEFFRAWEYYLVACELGFRHAGLTVYQFLVGKKIESMPTIRSGIFEEEERLSGVSSILFAGNMSDEGSKRYG